MTQQPPEWGQPSAVPPPPPMPPTSQPAPGAYVASGWGTPIVQQTTEGLAIASMVCGIISIFTCGLILGPLAIVFGVISRRRIAESQGMKGGAPFALTGLITGIAGLVLSIAIIVIYVVLIVAAVSSNGS